MSHNFATLLVMIATCIGVVGCSNDDDQSENKTVQLYLSASDGGTITPEPIGKSCGNNCYAYTPNTDIMLSAQANSSYSIDHWSGSCSGSGIVCNITLSTDEQIDIVFRSILAYWDNSVWGEMLWQ